MNLTLTEDNQATVRIIISGKNPNMRYLARTQRVDIARLNQFYEEKLFTFVDCPTEYRMRDLQTTGHFARDHLGEIIKGSAAAPAKGGYPRILCLAALFLDGLVMKPKTIGGPVGLTSTSVGERVKVSTSGNDRASYSSGGLKQERREFWLMTQGVAKPRRLRSSRRTEMSLSCGIKSPADRAARLLPRESNQICLR